MYAAALIYGPHSHQLDHLGPLSQLLGIPLFITEEEIFAQARIFYPGIDARLYAPPDMAMALLQDHHAVFSCLSKTWVDELFFFAQHALRKKIYPIWCPHGHCDRGYKSGFMNNLSEEKAALIYGPRMLELFKACEVLENLRAYALTGNYRWKDYRIHQEFYDRSAADHIRRKLREGRIFLFAPSWQNSEEWDDLKKVCETLILKLPPQTNLIIKLHSDTLLEAEMGFKQLQAKYGGHPGIFFLHQYPHLYSLLSICDLYIGDTSSIGYEFIAFDRPMIFLNHQNLTKRGIDPETDLGRCGISLSPIDYPRIYNLIEELLPFDRQLFSSIRKQTYTYTFGETKMPEVLRAEITALIHGLSSDEII